MPKMVRVRKPHYILINHKTYSGGREKGVLSVGMARNQHSPDIRKIYICINHNV